MFELVPEGFEVPLGLEHERFRLRKLTIDDVVKDFEALNERRRLRDERASERSARRRKRGSRRSRLCRGAAASAAAGRSRAEPADEGLGDLLLRGRDGAGV